MKLFLIGPGGVGKTTVGRLLAKSLRRQFIDLDEKFHQTIGNITDYIHQTGYQNYCQQNSDLFYQIISEQKENDQLVFALSSGFLIYKNLGQKHLESLQEEGLTILLLPSRSLEESTEIIIKRQLERGFGLNEEREREKFTNRFEPYKQWGDLQIFSSQSPDGIIQEIICRLKNTHFFE